MKHFFVAIFSLTACHLYSQNLIGKYKDYFGRSIEFKEDSTYEYDYYIHMSGSWNVGSWRVSNDTIYLERTLIYDTLVLTQQPEILDSLVLSLDHVSNTVDIHGYVISIALNIGQDRIPNPEKLFFLDGKLYKLDSNGQIITEEYPQFWGDRKYPTYFFTEE